MPIHITVEQEFMVGVPTVIEGAAPEGPFVAVFEDNETTGYFYALDKTKDVEAIQDAMHIYNVANVTDKAQPSIVKIGWSADNLKAALLINDYPHAIFDFSSQQGYCRTGFPSALTGSSWSSKGHDWKESAAKLFA